MKKIFKYVLPSILLFGLIVVGAKLSQPTVVNDGASYAKNYTVQEVTYEARNIVIGKIISNSTKDSYDVVGFTPRTDSVVHIERVIKGNLSGNIIFSQEGGLEKETNTIHIIDGYDILTPGQQYLFFINNMSDDYPDFVREHPILEGKYHAIGGAPNVYKIEGKMAKNVVMKEKDKDFPELEQVIKTEMSKKIVNNS